MNLPQLNLKYLFIFLSCYFAWNNFLLNYSLTGTYKSVSFSGCINLAEHDTLMFFGDYEFYSSDFGYGNYELSYSSTGTEIFFHSDFNPTSTSIGRTWLGKPKINMDADLNCYYEKIYSTVNMNNAKLDKIKSEQIKVLQQIEKEQKTIQEKMYNN